MVMCAVRKDKEGYLCDIHMPSGLANFPDGTQVLQAPFGGMDGGTKHMLLYMSLYKACRMALVLAAFLLLLSASSTEKNVS